MMPNGMLAYILYYIIFMYSLLLLFRFQPALDNVHKINYYLFCWIKQKVSLFLFILYNCVVFSKLKIHFILFFFQCR